MNSSNGSQVKLRKLARKARKVKHQSWKSARKIEFRRCRALKNAKNKGCIPWLGIANLVVAIMSVVTPIFYSIYLSSYVEIRNEEKKDKHYIEQDLKLMPATVESVGLERFLSRYFVNGENKRQVEHDAKNYKSPSGDAYNIGRPISYCNEKYLSLNGECKTEIGALVYSFITLKGTTQNPSLISSIEAVIDNSEDFSPEVLYFAVPQGVGENVRLGFNLGSEDLKARQVIEGTGVPTNTEYSMNKNINVKKEETVSITASFLVPQGKKIDFHLEICFYGHDNPLIVKDGDKPLSVVSYPAANKPPKRTYVPVNVTDKDPSESYAITQCLWYDQCRQMVAREMKSKDVSRE